MSTVPSAGEIRIFSGQFDIKGWQSCDGRLLRISEFFTLFELLGNRFGGNGTTHFALPNLPPLASANGETLRYLMATDGDWPLVSLQGFVGEIRLFPTAAPFPVPKNWTLCDGKILPATQILQAVIGNAYGGGPNTVGVPSIASPLENVSYLMCTNGASPISNPNTNQGPPTDAFLAEVRNFAGANTPNGYLGIGRPIVLPITPQLALFSLLGTRFGGDGKNFFGLPQLLPLAGGGAQFPYIFCIKGFFPQRP